MKKMVLVIALAAIALSGSAFAQTAYQNNIGVYLDESADTSCATLEAGAHTTYVVLTKLTAGEVAGWEGKLTSENIIMNSLAHRYPVVNAANRPGEYIIGFSAPVPAAGGSLVLAELPIFLANTDPAFIFIDGVFLGLLDNGLPAYVDGSDNGIELHPALGLTADPVFIVNDDCTPVAVDETTFGSVKGLFR
jgi:hypothetical protein